MLVGGDVFGEVCWPREVAFVEEALVGGDEEDGGDEVAELVLYLSKLVGTKQP